MLGRIGSVDRIMLGCVLVLLALGVAIVFGSSVYMAQRKDLASTYFFWKHLANVAAGCAVMLGALFVPARSWERIARPLFVFAVLLLVLVLVPGLGKNLNGAQRWFRGPLSVQPSEIAKIAIVFFLAFKLKATEHLRDSFSQGMFPPLVSIGLVAGLLVLEPSNSMALIVAGIGLSMLFVWGCRLSHILALAFCGLPAIGVVLMSQAHSRARIAALLGMGGKAGSMAANAATHQSDMLKALGNGQLTGTGIGRGALGNGQVSEPFTDAIFSMLGEQLGFLGSALVLFLFGVLVWRGVKIARGQDDVFRTLVAFGMTMLLALNVFIHVGVCVQLGPATGQPLPLISYGGTSMVVSLFACGVLLGLSRKEAAKGVSA